MKKITRNVGNKKTLLPKKRYDATNNAVRHFKCNKNHFPLIQTIYNSYKMDVQFHTLYAASNLVCIQHLCRPAQSVLLIVLHV